MPEVVYYVASSLDGYIATPDGGIEWLKPFDNPGEDYGYASFYASIDAVLVGRRTFEQSLSFPEWPYAGKPCWVFSRRKIQVPRPDVSVTAGDPRRVMEALYARGLRRAWLVGGGELAGAFQARGLITEYIVSVIPVILGYGIPMLGAARGKKDLKLTDTKSYSSGIVQLRYRPG